MKALSLALAAAAALSLSACSGERGDEAVAEAASDAASDAPRTQAAAPGRPAAPRSPNYAVLPEDGVPETAPTVADGPNGAGGMVTYATALSPDEVIEFHKRHAESAGLATVSTMTLGEARAYGAAAQDGSGAGMNVVASPVAAEGDAIETSVSLTWTAGG
jgi:hypothetical protein